MTHADELQWALNLYVLTQAYPFAAMQRLLASHAGSPHWPPVTVVLALACA